MAATRPNRVCLLYGDYPPKPIGKEDGGADFVEALAERLSAKGLLVTVIVSSRNDRPQPYVTPTGVRSVPSVDYWSIKGAVTGQFARLRAEIRRANIEVIHVVFPDPYLRYGSDSYHLPFLVRS